VKGRIVIAIPLVTLFAATSASLVLQHTESRDRSVGVAANNLTNSANLVLADMVNAETGVRGYAAVRDPIFLAPYNLMLTRIGAERNSLRDAAVVAGDRGQQQVADATTRRLLVDFAQLRSVAGRGLSTRNLQLALEQQKTTMDLLRRQIADLAVRSAALSAAINNKVTRLTTATNLLDGAALALGLLAGLAGIALFTSGIARRVGANAANAGRLGEGQRLEPDAGANDEIGQLSHALIQAEELLAARGAQLATAMDAALRANTAKNTFLSSTSHELRTPLNSILGFTQLLELSDLSEENSDSVRRILGAGRHLLLLINELIDFARIESGDLSLSLEPVLVNSVVEEISQLMAPIAAGRSIRIIQDCAHPALAVRADRKRLFQVLVNLISNAIKYNHRDGTVTISCQEEGTGQAIITVSDTGPGISPENIERVFIPFERLGAEQTAVEGTGIGLPLARALTEAMKGRLTLSSVPGQGSAFTISLPRTSDLVYVPRPGLAAAPPTVWPHAPAGPSISVLLIEDNPANVEMVCGS
jgi:signal transduction histidine kinase